MPRTVTHDDLVAALEYAITKTRADGRVHVVDSLVDWRSNYGSSSNRITRLYGVMMHHTGSEIAPDRIVGYARGLATGSIRPDIGRVLCNTTTVRAGQWPGSAGKPTVVVNAADYTNNAGMIDQAILDELRDGDIDTVGEFKPGTDDLYGNRHFWGDEAIGAYADPGQQLAFVVFWAHALAYLSLHVDTDDDGRRAPVVGHREGTSRKVDPARADMVEVRRRFEELWAAEYGIDLPDERPADPLVVTRPLPADGEQLVVDGVLGRATIAALQRRVGATVDGVLGPDTRRRVQGWLGVTVDGIWGRRTIRALQGRVGAPEDGVWGRLTTMALQRYLNGPDAGPQAPATRPQLVADGIIGTQTIRALQEWVGARVDGIWGAETTRKLQAKVGAKVDGVRGAETTRKLQAVVGAKVDGVWGPATTRALQTYLNNHPR